MTAIVIILVRVYESRVNCLSAEVRSQQDLPAGNAVASRLKQVRPRRFVSFHMAKTLRWLVDRLRGMSAATALYVSALPCQVPTGIPPILAAATWRICMNTRVCIASSPPVNTLEAHTARPSPFIGHTETLVPAKWMARTVTEPPRYNPSVRSRIRSICFGPRVPRASWRR
jgi:hypothetical protein